MALGSLLVPITRRELAASVLRVAPGDEHRWIGRPESAPDRSAVTGSCSLPRPASCRPTSSHRVGWSLNALPPLLLLIGLIQLAYCDLTRRLLPKTLVYALSAAVIASGVIVAGRHWASGTGFLHASLGRAGLLRPVLHGQPR